MSVQHRPLMTWSFTARNMKSYRRYVTSKLVQVFHTSCIIIYGYRSLLSGFVLRSIIDIMYIGNYSSDHNNIFPKLCIVLFSLSVHNVRTLLDVYQLLLYYVAVSCCLSCIRVHPSTYEGALFVQLSSIGTECMQTFTYLMGDRFVGDVIAVTGSL